MFLILHQVKRLEKKQLTQVVWQKVNMLNSGELVLNMMPITCIWQQCILKPRI